MSGIRKITANLPAELLAQAQAATGKGVTETLREALQMVAMARAYRELRALRGKVHLKVDLDKLREDRY